MILCPRDRDFQIVTSLKSGVIFDLQISREAIRCIHANRDARTPIQRARPVRNFKHASSQRDHCACDFTSNIRWHCWQMIAPDINSGSYD